MSFFGILHKNKRQFGLHAHRKFFVAMILFLVFGVTGVISLILNVLAAEVPVRSVEFFSQHTSFTNNEAGSWKITKSAEWTDIGKARITFEVESIAKYDNSKYLDVVLVIDNSGSMSGTKITQVKTDATDLANSLLSDSNNRMALITFNSSASILSELSNDKDNIISLINSINTPGSTNYYRGLLKAEDILADYEQQDGRELVLLFLTDGYPNEETPNEIAQYETLKAKYPYMIINGIQYEMGNTILQPIIDVSDNQFIASMSSLNNILFEATIVPYIYDEFIIADYINDSFWSIEDIDAIEASLGSIDLTYDSSTPKITWDMGGLLRSGNTATLTIDIDLKSEIYDLDLLLPTNIKETIQTKLEDIPDEDIESTLTPILKNTYDVVYDANAPADCEVQGQVPATSSHTVFTSVEISDNQLTCSGYIFKGWDSAQIHGSNRINDDYFRMPGEDVYIKAIWAKPSISKSMDGEMHVKATATFDTGLNVNAKLKKLSGQSDANYSTSNTTITTIAKADILSSSVDTNDSKYILSSNDSIVPIYGWYDNGTIYYYTNAEEIYLNANSSNMFQNLRILSDIEMSSWNTSNVTNMGSMFYYAGYSATTWSVGDLSGWDTSSVTNMGSMFSSAGYSATTWSVGDLSGWDTSSVTNMGSIFNSAGRSATTWSVGDLSGWNTSNVTNMGNMFNQAGYKSTTWSVGDLSGWDTSSVKDMTNMFYQAGYKSTTWSVGNLSGWDTSSVTSMGSMFSSAGLSATTWSVGDLSGWDTSSVTNMGNMFYYAGYSAQTFNLNLSGWDTSSVTNMGSMFSSAGRSATTWSVGDLSGWDTSSVTSMSSMFSLAGYSATTWSVGNLSGWNTSSVTNMSYMLQQAGYKSTTWSIGDLSSWDTSSVTNMSYMFNSAGRSTTTWSVGDLSGWNTSSVTNMGSMFNSAGRSTTTWSVGDLSGWNTSSVKDMDNMFNQAGYSAQTFNLNLSGWDTSSVTNMSYMLNSAGYSATTWSIGDLSGWDTSSVTNMSYMLQQAGHSATTWSIGDLSGWDTSSVTNMGNMFSSAGYSAQTFNLNLSGWDTSSVTSMSYMFSSAGYSAQTFNLNLSGWDTSSVTSMGSIFNSAGHSATSWTVTIPSTNGAGISNTASNMYGNTTSVTATPPSGKSFTLTP